MLRLQQGKGQPIRADGPQSHLVTKKGTPTMGGLMILSGIVVSTLLWANLANRYVWIVLGVTLGFGLIGFYDDYLKVTQADAMPASPAARASLIEALIAAVACYRHRAARRARRSRPRSRFRSSRSWCFDLGWFFILFGAFIIVGAGNAVNLTDGLDGLAIVPVMIAALQLRLHRLSRRQRGLRRLSADPLRRRHRRAGGAVRRGDRRRARLPLVQRAAGVDLHGRHRLARARRHARRDRGRDQARDRAGDRSAACSCSKRCR